MFDLKELFQLEKDIHTNLFSVAYIIHHELSHDVYQT